MFKYRWIKFYRLSKNLLNCISKNLSIDLKNYNVFSFSIDPGDVKTGINQLGVLDTDYVSKKILESLIDYKRNNGKFINLFGNELETWNMI